MVDSLCGIPKDLDFILRSTLAGYGMVHTWNSTVKAASLEHLRLCFRERLKTDRQTDRYIHKQIHIQ